MIAAEVDTMVRTLKEDVKTEICIAGQRSLVAFFDAQLKTWSGICEAASRGQTDISAVLDLPKLKQRDILFNRIAQNLDLAS